MRNYIVALGLLASSAIAAFPAVAATWTFTGQTETVFNRATQEEESYTVKFTYDDSFVPIVSPGQIFQGPPVAYQMGYFANNITSFTVTGTSFNLGFTSGASSTSTLDTSRYRDGNAGFHVYAGDDGTEPGFAVQFNYLFASGTPLTTAMPTSLNLSTAFDSGFAVLAYYLNEDDPESPFIDSYEAVSTRFTSISLTQDATAAVPEPASWAMMIGGFGMIGGALRRKRSIAVSFG